MESTQPLNRDRDSLLDVAYRAADLLQEAGTVAWRKATRAAQSVAERVRSLQEDGETQGGSSGFDLAHASTKPGAAPVRPGPSGVDIVEQAAPEPPARPEPPAVVDVDTPHLEEIAPVGAGMAREMLEGATGK